MDNKFKEAKKSKFRIWLGNVWLDHCREILNWERHPVTYSMKAWVRKNKWFLKAKFKEQKNKK